MQHEWNLRGVKVHIGIPAYGDIAPQTSLALTGTLLMLASEGVEFALSVKYGNCYVDQVRSIIAKEFLAGPADYLFHIDSDMVWEPREFVQVLAHTTVMDAVSVAYRMKDEVEKYTVSLTDDMRINEYGCLPLAGGGLGFACVQRRVIEALAERAEKVTMGVQENVPWMYRCRSKEGKYQGEDMMFFDEMRAAGFKPFIDTSLTVGHLGRKEYRGSLLESLLNAEDGALTGWRYPKDVEGWLSNGEAMALARLARGKEVVEIGSYCGKSTIAMAQVAKSIESIDWHKGDEMAGPGGTLGKFRYNLSRYSVDHRVRVHEGRTQEIAPTLPGQSYDLVFIDGAHDEMQVRIDVKEALRLVKPGGTIALHDFQMEAVQRVAHESLGKHTGIVDTMAWFQMGV